MSMKPFSRMSGPIPEVELLIVGRSTSIRDSLLPQELEGLLRVMVLVLESLMTPSSPGHKHNLRHYETQIGNGTKGHFVLVFGKMEPSS